MIPVNPVFDGFVGSVSLVHDGIKFLVGGDEKQRRESFQRREHVRDVVSGPIQLSKHDVLVRLQQLLGHFLVNGVELFAVSAPGLGNSD